MKTNNWQIYLHHMNLHAAAKYINLKTTLLMNLESISGFLKMRIHNFVVR